SHEYVKVEGEFAYLGITDYAQSQLGSVVYVDMPSEGDEISAGENFGAVESVKAASDLTSPISGEVVAINEQLEDNPELLNEDAFENWIVKVKLTNPQELNDLMSVSDYKEICK
ncbi:MAG: glycine cleavage system protein GcvH, partial [Alloprevotella tannerae]|nr:glycine cleavage system protein GcvH [Alloprevotella tannerae]